MIAFHEAGTSGSLIVGSDPREVVGLPSRGAVPFEAQAAVQNAAARENPSNAFYAFPRDFTRYLRGLWPSKDGHNVSRAASSIVPVLALYTFPGAKHCALRNLAGVRPHMVADHLLEETPGWTPWIGPSARTIARSAGIGTNSVQGAVHTLVDAGLVETRVINGAGINGGSRRFIRLSDELYAGDESSDARSSFGCLAF